MAKVRRRVGETGGSGTYSQEQSGEGHTPAAEHGDWDDSRTSDYPSELGPTEAAPGEPEASSGSPVHKRKKLQIRTDGWSNLADSATVEVSSEDPDFPVEAVFAAEKGVGWRAETSGEQTLRLIFDDPVMISRIHLAFEELAADRTQEFVLRWCGTDHVFHHVLRQQYNFSPNGSTRETEDYKVNLQGVQVLELVIQPDITAGAAFASLATWHLG